MFQIHEHLTMISIKRLLMATVGILKRKSVKARGRSFIVAVLFTMSSTPVVSSTSSDSIPIFPDLVYEYRITELNHLTPIELEYNEYVRRFIDVYTIEQREHMAEIAGRAKRYFPMIEQMLDKYDLPHELKYLAVIESALDPFAVSKSGAVGLWQFKLHSSRMFDLTVNSYIDERRDPYKSTEAACKYLQYLYRIHNNWQLALAAYNGGPGVVRKAIARSKGKQSFWELYPFLPAQTKSYVPAFIAVNYAMNHLDKHKITSTENDYEYFNTDTLKLNYGASFKNISKQTGVSVTTLKELNPGYRRNFIPNMSEKTILILPKKKVLTFLKNEEKIYNGEMDEEVLVEHVDSSGMENKQKLTHFVKKGDFFHKIAMKYNCTIEDIREWNSLSSNNIQVGQELTIWVDPEYIEKIEEERLEYSRKMEADTNRRVIFYKVQQGDTIWSIANKFNCESIGELIKANDIKDENDIKPGIKLKIYLDH